MLADHGGVHESPVQNPVGQYESILHGVARGCGDAGAAPAPACARGYSTAAYSGTIAQTSAVPGAPGEQCQTVDPVAQNRNVDSRAYHTPPR
jgi:hypothetical protein